MTTTPESRTALRYLLDSDDWKPVQEALDKWKAEKQAICGTVREDHRFWQGYWRGVVDFEAQLRAVAQGPIEPPPSPPDQFERAANGRNADGGAY